MLLSLASKRNWLKFALISAAVSIGLAGTGALPGIARTTTFKSAADFNNQTVAWNSCGTDLYCGQVLVPMDWAKPEGTTISLAVIYHRASAAKPLGSVIFNPGGPGASGYDFVRDSLANLATTKLKANYNFVGFDPRGVQNSVPAVHCYVTSKTAASPKMDQFLYGDSGYPLGSTKDLAVTRLALKDFADACAANTGPLLGHLDTISTARDLDVIRAVMGDAKLNYLGYSYGTFIGANYAALFPTKVGKMVLDGAVDPTVPDADQSLNQLKGFNLALNDYLADCLGKSNCPFNGSVAAASAKIKGFLLGLETSPISTQDHGRKLTVAMATAGIDMALYSKNYWTYLTAGFTSAFKGDGTTLQRLADYYNDRNTDGTYNSNEMEVFIATKCLDSREPSDLASMKKQNKRILAASSVMGRYWQYGGLSCAYWKYPVAKPLKSYAAKGSPTIVVVGTTGDPATPYQQAVNLANKVLSNATLITYKGEGHTAYGQGHSCVDNAVDDFFTAGTLPATGLTCQ
jgi:pimeloyl-ACP methyl ester carboxylesterase